MGVHGVATYAQGHLRATSAGVALASYLRAVPSCKKVLVDFDAFVYWVVNAASTATPAAPFPALFGGDYADLGKAVSTFISSFRAIGLEPIFVRDGYSYEGSLKKAEAFKRSEHALERALLVEDYAVHGTLPQPTKAKRLKRVAEEDADAGGDDDDSRLSSIINEAADSLGLHVPGASAQAAATAVASGCSIHTAAGEADSVSARIAAGSAEVLGVISEDSDFLFFSGVRYIPLSGLLVPGLNVAVSTELSAQLYEYGVLASNLEMPTRLLPDLAVLCGNDYTKQLLKDCGVFSALKISMSKRGPEAIADFLDSNCCSCEGGSASDGSDVTAVCAGCNKPLHIEGLTSFSAVLAAHPALVIAVRYSRDLYSLRAPPLEGLYAALAQHHLSDPTADSGAAVPVDSSSHHQLPGAMLAARLQSSRTLTALYCAQMISALPPGGTLRLLEERSASVRLGAEAVPFQHSQASSVAILRPLRAIRYGWLLPSGRSACSVLARAGLPSSPSVIELVPVGALLGQSVVRPFVVGGPELDGSSGTKAHFIPALALRVLPLEKRQSLYAAAAAVPLTSWLDGWLMDKAEVTNVNDYIAPATDGEDEDGDEEAEEGELKRDDGLSSAMQRLSLGGTAGSGASSTTTSPWLRAGYEPHSDAPSDPASFASVQATASAAGTAAAAVARALAVQAARYLIAVTSHYYRQFGDSGTGVGALPFSAATPLGLASAHPIAADLPTLRELASALAMVALLQAGAPAGPEAHPLLERPRIRTCALSTWWQGVNAGLLRLSSILQLSSSADDDATDVSSLPMTGGEGDDVHPLTGTPLSAAKALVKRVLGIDVSASSQAPTESGGPLPEPQPRETFDGRLLHALCQGLGDWGLGEGVPLVAAAGRGVTSPSGASSTMPSAPNGIDAALNPSDPVALLSPFGREIVNKHGCASVLCDMWTHVLRPFDPVALQAGYRAIAEGVVRSVAPPFVAAVPSPLRLVTSSSIKEGVSEYGTPIHASTAAAPVADNTGAAAAKAAPPSRGLTPAAVVTSKGGPAGDTTAAADAIKRVLFGSPSAEGTAGRTAVASLPAPLLAAAAGAASTTAASPADTDLGGLVALPITKYRAEIIRSIALNTVSIVKGDTGSGKSSRLPHYILQQSLSCSARAASSAARRIMPSVVPPEVWGDRKPSIFVTQPRRIAAVTLAKRVADEVGQANGRKEEVGGTVGFRIGNERKGSSSTRLTFVTTGWLLQWLVGTANEDIQGSNGRDGGSDDGGGGLELDDVTDALGRLTHVVLDEVHERGVDTDLVCLVLRMAIARGMKARLLALRRMQELARVHAPRGSSSKAPSSQLATLQRMAALVYARRVRLVLMSATFDTTIFADYFERVAEDYAAQLAAEVKAHGTGALDMRLSIPATLYPSAEANPFYASGSAAPLSLSQCLEGDKPTTLHVGAKRFPVTAVYLEEIYSVLRGLPLGEVTQVAAAQQKFEMAARAWSGEGGGMSMTPGKRGGRRGGGRASQPPPRPPPSATQSVGDALTLNDQAQTALQKLAVRIAVAVAKPGTGDCILIFVSGMQDINDLVELFQEMCPGRVAAPEARFGVGEDQDEADYAAMGEARARVLAEQAKRLEGDIATGPTEGEEEDAGNEEEEGTALDRAGAAAATAAADATPSRGGPSKRGGGGRGGRPATTPIPYNPETDRSTIRLIPMHSLISMEDQMAAFNTSSGDMRTRVVIATNVAESSVTLPDVHTVIDFGRSKTVEYVPKMRTSMLRSTWTSQASAAQRAGRSGRLMPGTVFRLYTRSFHDCVMPKYDVPEMLRLSLDSVVLKVKLLGIKTDAADAAAAAATASGGAGAPSSGIVLRGKAAEAAYGAPMTSDDAGTGSVNSAKAVLLQSLQAPDPSNVDSALERLAALGALSSSSDTAEVTPFGRMLASFPGDLTLGKLVAFSGLLGCLPDGIVMAAALSVQTPFIMPHSAVAESPEEYARLVHTVTRGQWLFSREAAFIGSSSSSSSGVSPWPHADEGRYAGSAASGWSEPIAARNAYIAWRCIPAAVRPSWCRTYGLMHRRMLAMNNAVRDVAQRISTENPAFSRLAAQLMGRDRSEAAYFEQEEDEEGDKQDATASSRGGKRASSASWPPEGLFCTDSNVLRACLLAAMVTNVAEGRTSEKASFIKKLGKTRLDSRATVGFRFDASPTAWLNTADLAVKDPVTKQALYVGDLARGLRAVGLSKGSIQEVAVNKQAKAALMQLAPDWDLLESAAAAQSTTDSSSSPVRGPRGSGSTITPSRSGGSGFGSPGGYRPHSSLLPVEPDIRGMVTSLPPFAARMLGLARFSSSSSDSSSSDAFGPASDALPALAPIAYALPLNAMALAFMSGVANVLRVPKVALEGATAKTVEEATGGRAYVPGAAFVEGASGGRIAGLVGLAGSPGSPSLSRAALPMHGIDVSGGGADEPVDVGGPAFPVSTTWHLLDATTGYRAFATTTQPSSGNDGAYAYDEDVVDPLAGVYGGYPRGGGGRGKWDDDGAEDGGEGNSGHVGLSRYSARLPQTSLLRLIADLGPSDDARRMHPRLACPDVTVPPGTSAPPPMSQVLGWSVRPPMLAVSSSLQLMESTGPNGHKRLVANMQGTTVLWRHSTTLALSLLLFSRGVDVQLTWTVGPTVASAAAGGSSSGGGSSKKGKKAAAATASGDGGGLAAVVTSVAFDPSGPSPLLLSNVAISSDDLREVATLRRFMSSSLNHSSLQADTSLSNELRGRMLRLLRLAPGAPEPPTIVSSGGGGGGKGGKGGKGGATSYSISVRDFLPQQQQQAMGGDETMPALLAPYLTSDGAASEDFGLSLVLSGEGAPSSSAGGSGKAGRKSAVSAASLGQQDDALLRAVANAALGSGKGGRPGKGKGKDGGRGKLQPAGGAADKGKAAPKIAQVPTLRPSSSSSTPFPPRETLSERQAKLLADKAEEKRRKEEKEAARDKRAKQAAEAAHVAAAAARAAAPSDLTAFTVDTAKSAHRSAKAAHERANEALTTAVSAADKASSEVDHAWKDAKRVLKKLRKAAAAYNKLETEPKAARQADVRATLRAQCRKLLAKLLSQHDCQVARARHAEAALDLCRVNCDAAQEEVALRQSEEEAAAAVSEWTKATASKKGDVTAAEAKARRLRAAVIEARADFESYSEASAKKRSAAQKKVNEAAARVSAVKKEADRQKKERKAAKGIPPDGLLEEYVSSALILANESGSADAGNDGASSDSGREGSD